MKQPAQPGVLLMNTSAAPTVTARCCLVAGATLALLVAGSATATASAPQRIARADLEEFEKFDLDELAEKYQEFFDDVEVIITEEEEEIFLHLASDSQRDNFMEEFWDVRDPSPGTPANEYKEEYDRRVEHVEKFFGRGTPRPPKKTDRGRMYLLLGEPLNIKSFPVESLTHPVEAWWYHADPKLGIAPFFSLIFFKPNGIGELRLYNPLVDGPMALLNPTGQDAMRSLQQRSRQFFVDSMDSELAAARDVLREVDGELAQAAVSLIPGQYGRSLNMGSMESQMLLADIQNLRNKIMPNATWAYPILTGMVEADVRFESLPIRAQAIALLDPSGVPFLHYGLLTQGDRLNLNDYDGSWYVTFQIAGTVVDDQNRIVTVVKGADGSTPRILQADLEEAEARKLRGSPLLYLDRLPVVSGSYDFDLVLENNVSREYGHESFAIDVPAAWPVVLRSSRPLLLWAAFDSPDYDRYADHYPFQIGRYGFVPALEPSFNLEEGLRVFQQLYLPRGHQGRIRATYRLSKDNETVIDHVEFIDPTDADGNGTVNHVAHLELEGVEAGEYELFVDLDGDDRGGTTYTVTIDPQRQDPPHLHMSLGPPPTDPWFAFDRAQQFRSMGQIDEAIEALRPAVERVDDDKILTLQTNLMMEAERYQELEALLMPLQRQEPNNTDVLMALAAVHSHMGNNAEAIKWYERVRLANRPEESTEVLNPLASAYFADGDRDKAREMLEKSLEVNPDQPEIRRLLDEVLGREGGGAR